MRKGLAFFMILCILLLTVFCSATAAPAVVLTPEITVSDGGESWMFKDNNRTTKRAFKAGGSLTLKNDASDKITSLYLIWDAPAPERCVVTATGLAPIKTQGFIHEWIDLAGAVGDTVTLTWEGPATLCDVVALGGSDLPDWVQLWRPAEGDCDILLLPTHADDEHLYLGGALALAAATPGCQLQVAYMVNHNGEYYRPHELLNGLWAVGVNRYPVIPDFPDVYSDSLEHARTIYDEQTLLDYQLSLIGRFRPQVIVGHDLNGEYGHGAHRLNAHTLTGAVEQAAADGWDTPKLYLHLYDENVPEHSIVLNLDTPLTNDNAPREGLSGLTPFEIAQLGFAAHKSQQTFFKVEQSGPYDCRKLGLYRSTVGPDTRDDIFEHITLRANQPEPEPEPALTDDSPVELPPSDGAQDKTPYLPEVKNDRVFAFIGSPLALALSAIGLLAAVLLYVLYKNRRI